MASVREELIDDLVGGWDVEREDATAAVDKAIKAWEDEDEPDGWEDKLEWIYSNEKLWKKSE